jgi:O-antigen ligase
MFSRNPWKPVPPLWLVGFFAALAMGAYGIPLPETWAIGIAIGCFVVVAALHPLNGVSFLLLVIPFFLGNSTKPYIFLLEIFIYGTLLSMIIRRPWLKKGAAFPLKIPVLLFLLSAVLSLPVNARELYYTLWTLPPRDLFFQWLIGNPGAPVHGLRVLTNVLSAAALCAFTFRALEEPAEDFIIRNIKAMVLMAALMAIVGFLFFFQWLPRGRSYASLSLAGVHEGAITAFAFNRQFLAQYLLLCLPLAFFLGLRSLADRNTPWLVLIAGSIALSIFGLAASMQRSVYIVLALQVGFLLVGYGWLVRINKKWLILCSLAPFLIVGGLLILDWTFLNQRFIHRLQYLERIKDIRPALWSTAWAMFTFSPWLGIGLGKFYYFFPDFFPGPPGAWQQFNANRGNAHSLVVQLLAEQGLFGCLAFIFLVAVLLALACRGLIRETRPGLKSLRFALITAVCTWLVLGLFHHIAYDLRSLEIFFWIFSAFLLALAPGLSRPFRPGAKTLLLFLALPAAAFGYQLTLIKAYPIQENFQIGFYHWEKDPEGGPVRWMGGRAAAYLETKKGDLLIECRASLPEVDKKPQEVRLKINGWEQRFTLRDRSWKRLLIRVPEPRGRHLLLLLETGYTFNPARAFGSPDHRDLGLQLHEFRWETP